MTTRQEVNQLCRRRLADQRAPFTFSDLQINQWIHDAIAEYSQLFPRTLYAEFTLQAGQTVVDLSGLSGFQTVLRVEYPLGMQPPRFLQRIARARTAVFNGRPTYDLDWGAPGGWRLYLGLTPKAGEKLGLTYQADHLYPAEDATPLTVPDRHLELIVLFVRMAALQEQLAELGAQSLPAPPLLGIRALNAARARQEYLEALDKARKREGESAIVGW
ncbi:MAG: hypothetical protein RML93_12200 [Anaerolineales bacterium]|nr:hypothetical protein [Anaerolineales bacterium]MCS7248881.1 hypothetical protein [Anaerolineales bacterium]MDW8162694.1 hypothetical protein [Anaerolineales bacterium]MDW8448035.1 hypothetical protein [Anaerolineales bacterium]